MPQPLYALALAANTTSTATRLHPIDLAIVAVYLVGITLFGLRFREKKSAPGQTAKPVDKSLKSYFLANNTIPWWAIALSIVSAETSTLTIISVPGVAFGGDFGFLQLVMGYMVGRVIVALLFLPRYFAGEMLTAYQLIDRRFGPFLHKVTAGLFLLTRAAAEGVRVFAVSIVVGIAIGTRDVLSIAIISALTLLYTFEGGLTAVIWTDVVQMILYIGGTAVAILTLGTHVPGGWHTIHTVAGAAGKFHLFNFAFNLTQTYTFWAGLLGGTFLTMASHGTDQLMVQRMLAARNLRESRLALLSSGAVIFLQFTLFLLIGAGLYVFYKVTPGSPNPAAALPAPDRLFPTFIVREMPIGVAGLLVAAILAAAMSNLSAALNSLSSTTVVDFYMRLRPAANARERNLISKSSTVLWAIVLFAIAVYSVTAGGKGHVVEIGLSIASVAYGCLLGVFLLGTLTRYANQWGTAIGMLCGFALNLYLWQGTFPKTLWHGDLMNCPDAKLASPGTLSLGNCTVPHLTIPHVAYPWYTLIGAAMTFAIGSLASLAFRHKRSPDSPAPAALPSKIATLLLVAVILSAAKNPCIPLAEAQTPRLTRILPFHPLLLATQSRHHKHTKHHAPKAFHAQLPANAPRDFTAADTLINEAIAARKLPGAVLLVGHHGHVVYTRAYGNRKLANEPGPSGEPSAEPMTEDTIFDMASLTKCLATATAVMQLYDAGKITSFDDPIAKYLPDFLAPPPSSPLVPPQTLPSRPEPHSAAADRPAVPATDPNRARVTLRMLLTHTSGEAPDVSLRDPWGLAAPDRAEGFRRALATPLAGTPGAKFVYSDINFILLGLLVETLSGQREDLYTAEHIYTPLGMSETRYLPLDRACGADITGAALTGAHETRACALGQWSPLGLLARIAPTAHDDESTAHPDLNPDFNHLLRATVHDPTTRRMGGVAGHAGLFSTAHDVGLYAQAFLDKLLRNTGPFPVRQATLQLMTSPQQPGANPQQLIAAQLATTAALAARAASNPASPANRASTNPAPPPARASNNVSARPERSAAESPATPASTPPPITDPLLAPAYPAIPGQNLRGFGWDIDTAFSKPRGMIFPIGSFGHTGFTGTTLWIDPASDSFYVLLANAIHPRGGPPISNLRGEVATAVAQALGLGTLPPSAANPPTAVILTLSEPKGKNPRTPPAPPQIPASALTGIDVLESTHFAALTTLAAAHNGHLNLGLLTNIAGIDRNRRRTIDILATDLPAALPGARLTTLFSPEHGIFGKYDTARFDAETDPATGLHATSLYGPKDADKRPSHDQLAPLDAVVIDLQDAGVRFWTYEAVLGYFLEAASTEQRSYNHHLDIVVLDRPALNGAAWVQGPVSDPGLESYTNYMPLPVRHGMTYAELARYINANKLAPDAHPLAAPLTVIPIQNWQRTEFFDTTGLPWVNPSPNMRNTNAAILYPGIALLESSNISVGRGTDSPLEVFGAGAPPPDPKTGAARPAWFHAADVAAALNARAIPGVTFLPTTIPVVEDSNHYPGHGHTIEAVRITLTDRAALDSPEMGIEIAAALHRLYPAQFQLEKTMRILSNRATLDALVRGDDPRAIARSWQPALDNFRTRRAAILLYPER